MKKLTAAIAALALYFSASAFGPNPENNVNTLFNTTAAKVVKAEKVSATITQSFQQEFSTAKNVIWKENQGLYFGYFLEDSKEVMVAYDRDGELVAVGRAVTLTDLPKEVTDKLKEKYADYTISNDASEVDMNNEAAYYVSVENKTSKKILKISAGGQVETFKTTKKKVLVGSVM